MSLTTLPNENEISGTGLLMQTDSILQPPPLHLLLYRTMGAPAIPYIPISRTFSSKDRRSY